MQEKQARIRLKKGKERPILQHHHWIYSGAVQETSSQEAGALSEVFSHEGTRLGVAMLNPGRSILGHMLAYGDQTVFDAISARITAAISLRKSLFQPHLTNALRLINAEGDGIPGLIVDDYAGVLVIQISHPALETLKPQIISALATQLNPKAIYEKSTSFLRRKEGMEEVRGLLYGEECPEVEIIENGLRFHVHLLEGQKTGLFLDQREMRALIRQLANKRRVLNCFAYTGGFSIAALAGGAISVDSVEISKKCEPAVLRNLQLNHLNPDQHRFLATDALDYIASADLDYELIILDPPAFVKKREDINKAFRAYKDLNAAAMRKMPPNSLLLTCSCSYHVSEELFQNILFRASLEAKRKVRILQSHRQAFDHPISIFHPESSYLKSFLLFIE